MGCWPLVQTKGSRGAVEVEDARQVVEWCELEKFHPLGMEMEVVWQVVDCFAPETQTLGPLGKNTFRGSSTCIMSRDAEVEVNASVWGAWCVQEDSQAVWTLRQGFRLGLWVFEETGL